MKVLLLFSSDLIFKTQPVVFKFKQDDATVDICSYLFVHWGIHHSSADDALHLSPKVKKLLCIECLTLKLQLVVLDYICHLSANYLLHCCYCNLHHVKNVSWLFISFLWINLKNSIKVKKKKKGKCFQWDRWQ